mgnify:CR=1 FL=1
MDLKGKKVLVFGAGKSGIGAADLIGSVGAQPIIYDGNENLDKEAVLHKTNGTYTPEIWAGAFPEGEMESLDLVVLSPGVPTDLPLVKSFYEKGLPVWSEVELAYRTGKGEVLAITGTNGKTTTTALLGKIMGDARESVFVVGNIGIPFTSVALDTTEDSAIAAEISSFQLETTIDFQPEVSAVLNVTPDHLDRHGTMEVYADTKFSISKKQNKDQVIVLNYDDPITKAMAEKATARPVMFSRLEELAEGIILRDDAFIIKENGKEMPVCTTSEIKLLGSHNHENILAAIGITYYMGVPVEQIRDAVMKFTAVEHRIEYVDTVDGVDYYNDSKGTNPDAAIKGISAMTKPTILLGGGYDKKSTYDEWIDAFHGKVRYLIVMGATAQAIADTAKKHGFHNVIFAETFEEAMDIAREKARPGDAVLLSPACASWGMFKNYEVRGKVFKEIVRKFKG